MTCRVLDRVVNQPGAVRFLKAAVIDPVHAYLFVGPEGSQKTEAARLFAAGLVCPESGCGVCRACRLVVAGKHPDVHEFVRVGASLTVEQAAGIVQAASVTPLESARKVIVVHDIDLMRSEAVSRLLKTVEEPSPSTVFVAVAGGIPPELVTVASRCVIVEFGMLSEPDVVDVLVSEGCDRGRAERVAGWCGGDLGRARVLVSDEHAVERYGWFERLPSRLDGTGTTVVTLVRELFAMIEMSAGVLTVRQNDELVRVAAEMERVGDRSVGWRRDMEERHRREQRRWRNDEIRSGLGVVARVYRDAARDGRLTVAEVSRVLGDITRVCQVLERNPNEQLLLQNLLLNAPRV